MVLSTKAANSVVVAFVLVLVAPPVAAAFGQLGFGQAVPVQTKRIPAPVRSSTAPDWTPAVSTPAGDLVERMRREPNIPLQAAELQLRLGGATPVQLRQFERLKLRWNRREKDFADLGALLASVSSGPCKDERIRFSTIDKGTVRGDDKRLVLASGYSVAMTAVPGVVDPRIEYDWYKIEQSPDMPLYGGPNSPPFPFTLSGWAQSDSGSPCTGSVDLLPDIDFDLEPIPESELDVDEEAVDAETAALIAATGGGPPPPPPPTITTHKDSKAVQLDCTQYLCGRDVILVHGLDIMAAADSSALHQPVYGEPGAKAQFSPGGWWYNRAAKKWENHVAFLAAKGARNRYIMAPWAITARADLNVNSISEMINEGMAGRHIKRMDRGRTTEGQFLAGAEAAGFCNPSCVLVSSSTGALLNDIMLGLGETTRTSVSARARYGDLYKINDRIKFHLAYQAAFGGSDLAGILKAIIDVNGAANASTMNAGLHSIAVDLTPVVARQWHTIINFNVKPVLYVASGSPDGLAELNPLMSKPAYAQRLSAFFGLAYPVTVVKAITPGPDDAVLSMSSACANDIDAGKRPSGMTIAGHDLPRVFDRGDANRGRARRLLWTQRYKMFFGGPAPRARQVGGMCNDVLTSTGMVLPASSSSYPYEPARTLNHHCPVIITPKPHGLEASATPDAQNREETLVIPPQCAFLYSASANVQGDNGRFLDPAIGNEMRQIVRKKTIGEIRLKFTIFKINFNILILPEIIIWRRKYLLLAEWEDKQSVDYVYDYVGR